MPSLHSTLDSLSRQHLDGGVALEVGFMGHSHRFENSHGRRMTLAMRQQLSLPYGFLQGGSLLFLLKAILASLFCLWVVLRFHSRCILVSTNDNLISASE